jgi:hypothetical protein
MDGFRIDKDKVKLDKRVVGKAVQRHFIDIDYSKTAIYEHRLQLSTVHWNPLFDKDEDYSHIDWNWPHYDDDLENWPSIQYPYDYSNIDLYFELICTLPELAGNINARIPQITEMVQ